MPLISVRIPQIGEGLQEARLVAVLKKPGDKVKRDEPIYQMETDKAVMDVESPYEGTLSEWLAPVDTILPIGGEVAKMEVADGTAETGGVSHNGAVAESAPSAATTESNTSAAGPRNANIPPRTRAYAKEKGVSEDQLSSIPAPSGKLMPADIDAFLAEDKPSAAKSSSSGAYDESELGTKQKVLNSRMVRGNALCVPGTISVAASWERIAELRERIRASGGDFQPSAFTMFAFAVAKTLKDHPSFRTTLVGDSTARTYKHAALGIAVALPGDELVTAVVEDSDTLSWVDFAKRSREKIDLARQGKDQVNEATTISLTNMQGFGLRDAVPVVVPPAVATLFLGEVYTGWTQSETELKLQKMVNLALTFDHRIVNGVGAANFLNAVKAACENIDALIKF